MDYFGMHWALVLGPDQGQLCAVCFRDTCWLVIACMDEMELHIQLSEMLGADKRLDRFDYLIGISMWLARNNIVVCVHQPVYSPG